MNILESFCNIIISGQITSRIEAKNYEESVSTIKAIVPKAIDKGRIKHNELTEVNLKKDLDTIRVTQKDDIVVKLSTPYDSAIITSSDEGLMVSSFCAIIRGFDDGYDPAFISAYLNTKYVREVLKASTTGSTTPLLKVSELKKLNLPDITLSKQRDIYDLYAKNMMKMELLQELLNNSEEMSESIILSNLEG